MSRNIRRLSGWPPKSGGPGEPPAVKDARTSSERAAAVTELQTLLDKDDKLSSSVVLSTKQRWALHYAIGVLQAKPIQERMPR